MDGAFFFQTELQVPEEEMTQHAGYHMVMPAWKFAHLVMVHAQVGFGFLETLLNCPTQAAQPDESRQPCAD